MKNTQINTIRYKYWLWAFIISLVIFFLCGLELSACRGWDANFYLTNKVLASTALLMICLSFLLSAFIYFWGQFSKQQIYARYLGLIGFGYAVIHIILSLLVDEPKNPGTFKFSFPDFFLDKWPAILCALIGFFIFFNMARISFPSNKKTLENATFRAQLRYGYIGVLFIMIHSGLLKYQGWIKWFTTYKPLLPPLSQVGWATCRPQ